MIPESSLFSKVPDATDRALLDALIEDARLPLKALASRVGMSSPGVAERLRRLQERGVIRRFTIDIDPEALGFTLEAIVRIRPLPGKTAAVRKLIENTAEIIECDKVTGDDCFVARVVVRSMGEIDEVLEKIGDKGATSTSMVKGHTVPRRPPPLGKSETAQ